MGHRLELAHDVCAVSDVPLAVVLGLDMDEVAQRAQGVELVEEQPEGYCGVP